MDNLKDKGPRDRSRISLSEEWEVKWWTKQLNISADELRKALSEVGNSVEKVRAWAKDKGGKV